MSRLRQVRQNLFAVGVCFLFLLLDGLKQEIESQKVFLLLCVFLA